MLALYVLRVHHAHRVLHVPHDGLLHAAGFEIWENHRSFVLKML